MSQLPKESKEHLLYLVNAEGHCYGVQLSMELWEEVQSSVKASLKKITTSDDPFLRPQPMEALADLKKYWDFTYPYEPSMRCEACNAATDNWEEDPTHPFHLTNANIAGLLVFRCRCGATVRKKHFHRKVVFECSPKNC